MARVPFLPAREKWFRLVSQSHSSVLSPVAGAIAERIQPKGRCPDWALLMSPRRAQPRSSPRL
eukprot:1981455-Prymnesium_polylepis.1